METEIKGSAYTSMTEGLNNRAMKIAENEILGCFRVLLGPVGNVCSLSPLLYKAVCEKQEFGGVAVGTVVALKVLPTHGDARNEYAQLQERVASLWNLSHHGIEKYHGCFPVYGIFGDRLVLVSEWLEGESLKDCLLRNPQGIGADEVLRVGAQLLSALTYLSARGIVHRDIKPTNIFLSKDGGVKLVGLDRSSFDLNMEVNEDACPVGTFNYMAPDFLSSGFHGDVQSDIFSLGVCLHEMLSGQLPYRKEAIGIKTIDGREQLRQRTECADAIQIDKRIDEILIGAVEVLEKALRMNREERYLTFPEFASAYNGIRRRKMPQDEDGKSVSLMPSASRLISRAVSAATAVVRVAGKICKPMPLARAEV